MKATAVASDQSVAKDRVGQEVSVGGRKNVCGKETFLDLNLHCFPSW